MTIEWPDGSLVGGLATAGLDLVVTKTRDLVDDPDAEVTVDVILPAGTDHRLQMAEELCDDAQKELEAAILELRAEGMSVADIGRIFRMRRLHPEPTPMTVSHVELAERGLTRLPNVTGVLWSDHGFAETVTCRACIEATRAEYRDLREEDGTNELLYGPVVCDFCDVGHDDEEVG